MGRSPSSRSAPAPPGPGGAAGGGGPPPPPLPQAHAARALRARRTAGPRAHLLQHAPPSPARGRALARPGARAIPRAAERLREEPPRARQRAPGTHLHPRAPPPPPPEPDRKSTRLNSSHLVISYAVFCLKKKKTT